MNKYNFLFCILIFLLSCESEDSSQTEVMQPVDSNENITYNLTIDIQGQGSVLQEDKNSNNGPDYSEGSFVKLTAIPSDGWVFSTWQGDVVLNENPIEIVMNSSKNLTAIFELTDDDSDDDPPTQGELIYLDSNGLTIKANSNAKPGDIATLNGVEYLIVDNDLLREIIVDETEDLSKLVTTFVTDMSSMFRNKQTLTPDITAWDTSNVTDMSYMFFNASLYNGDLSLWDTGKVTNMTYMFAETGVFNRDIGDWNTINVENMIGMFNKANSFNQDLSRWCVPLIPTRPAVFSNDSNLSENFIPKWGTCPD
ncbi:MAG: DUF285 domain-containing protein [Flavobacteriaceae bacterium]|nr:DUF285 domain-containing protein [Flavobacteriaceae bacterium]